MRNRFARNLAGDGNRPLRGLALLKDSVAEFGTMSTGLFMGVRGSYIDEAQASATAFLEAINGALSDKGIARYVDPQESPNVYKDALFGRSELDHHSSRVLVKIAVWALSRANVRTSH